MLYVILIAVVAFALYLIFSDDHDPSYNKSGRDDYHDAPQVKPEPVVPVKKEPEGYKLSWRYLYDMEYDEDIDEDSVETEITGMRYYCTLKDLGRVNGIVRPEPTNPHDHRAQVVIRADGKKLGYIPRYDLDMYEDFNPEGYDCPFAGEVVVNNNGLITAEIMVVTPSSRNYVKESLAEYLGEGASDHLHF